MASFRSLSSTNTCNSNATTSSTTSSPSPAKSHNKLLLTRGSSCTTSTKAIRYDASPSLVEQEPLSQTEQKAAQSLLLRRTNSILDSQEFTIHKLNLEGVQGHLFGRQAEIQKLQQSFLDRLLTPLHNSSPNSNSSSPSSETKSTRLNLLLLEDCPASLCSITGYSGTGKTALVEAALLQEVTNRRGFLVRGKFDLQQQQRGEPYTAIAAALGDLVDQIVQRHDQPKQQQDPIQQNDASAATVLEHVQKALQGQEMAFLTELIQGPGIQKLFVQKQSDQNTGHAATIHGNKERPGAILHPPASHDYPSLKNPGDTKEESQSDTAPTQDNQEEAAAAATSSRAPSPFFGPSIDFLANRRNFAVRHFLKAVTDLNVPLVIVLDDVQWIDPASTKLLDAIISSDLSIQPPNLFVVTTCRTNANTNTNTITNTNTNNQDQNHTTKRPSILGADMMMMMTNGSESDSSHHQNSSSNFLFQKLSSFRERQIQIDEVALSNLDLAAVNDMVSTLLRSSLEFSLPLAQLVLEKTHGNPMYVLEFIKSLVDDEELLTFHLGSLTWQWDKDKIQRLDVTDNVVDLLAGKVAKLPRDCQITLQVAACLGQVFDQSTLQRCLDHVLFQDKNLLNLPVVLMKKQHEVDAEEAAPGHGQGQGEPQAQFDTSRILQLPLRMGLIARIDQGLWSFEHDSFQAALLKMIPETELVKLQLLIGKQLLAVVSSSSESNNQFLFQAVDLCNIGFALLSPQEKTELATYNLRAGETAMRRSAFLQARRYMEQGLELLDTSISVSECENDQQTQAHSLDRTKRRLHRGVADAAYCCGDFEIMEEHFQWVLNHDGPIFAKLHTYGTKIDSLASRERFNDAIDTGCTVLSNLGVHLPRNPSKLMVLFEFLKTQRLTKKYSRKSLLHLPLMTDKRRLAAAGIIAKMEATSYISCPNLWVIMTLKVVRWSIKYGVCQDSPRVIAGYGIIAGCVFGDFRTSSMMGDVVHSIMNRIKAREAMPRAIMSYYGFLSHWTNDLHASIKPCRYGYQLAMEVGDVNAAAINLAQVVEIGFEIASKPLDDLAKDFETSLQIMKEIKQIEAAVFDSILLQAVHNLRGCGNENPMILTGDAADADSLKAKAKSDGNALMSGWVGNYQMQLAYLFGDYEQAGVHSCECLGYGRDIVAGHASVLRNFLFRGLTALALAAKGKQRRANRREALAIIKTMKKWQSAGNMNVISMLNLLEAELTALDSKKKSAMELYKQSIRSASRGGWLNNKALAHERAGLFYLSEGDEYWAAHHIDNAILTYNEWGATAKVTVMLEEFGDMLEKFHHGASGFSLSTLALRMINSNRNDSGILDVDTTRDSVPFGAIGEN